MEQHLSISESEWRVMKIVWSNSPQNTSRNIRQAKRNRLEQDDYSDIPCPFGKKRSIDYKTSREGIFVLSSSIRK